MEVLTTVGVLSKLPNFFPTRVSKQVYVGIAYPHLQYAFTSWGKTPATCKCVLMLVLFFCCVVVYLEINAGHSKFNICMLAVNMLCYDL